MFRSPEQAEFNQIVATQIADPDGPLLLEGAAGLGKTRAYLAAAFKSGKRVAICLATNQLIDQLLASSDIEWVRELVPDCSVADFRSRMYFEDAEGVVDRNAYSAQQTAAQEADILICTASSVIFDQRLQGDYNGVTNRDVIIFDEADQIPGLAALASDLIVDRATLRDLNCAGSTPIEVAEKLLALPRLESELKAKARIIAEITGEPEVWYKRVGMNDDGGVAIIHRLPGRLLKKIANRPSTIFISATLSVGGKFNDFRRSMGIDEVSDLSQIIEPGKHGTLVFSFNLAHEVGTKEWLELVVGEINEAEGMTLVVTPSFALAEELGSNISSARVRGRDETTSDAAADMGNSTVLIAAGAWAGLDTPIQWATVIVPRIPFTGPRDLFSEWNEDDDPDLRVGDPMASYLDSRNTAARRMVQVFGRGLRSPEAVCGVVILDPRISQLGDIAPIRFRGGWHEGRKIEVTLTTSERNPRLRRDALRHHGTDCQACDFHPLILRQVEVHHLHPLADRGPTVTTMQDVVVLCANCHRLAHKNGNNVIPLNKLREIAQASNRADKKKLIQF